MTEEGVRADACPADGPANHSADSADDPDRAPVVPRRGWLDPAVAWTRRSVATAIGLGLLIMVLTWVFRTGIVPTDPWHYVRSALHFPDATWVPLGYTRYGMILPLLPVVALFGNSEISYYVWPLIGSGLLTAVLYLLGLRFWGRSGALLAVVLGLISPITAVNLSRGYPDVIGTAIFGSAMVSAFVARDRMARVPVPSDTGPAGSPLPVVLLAAVGFLLGWGFEARETTILTWPAIAVILLGRRRRVLSVLGLLAAGIGVWVVADLAIGQFGYGDVLIRVHAFTHQDLATTTNAGDQAAMSDFVGRSRLFYLTEVPRLLLADGAPGVWTLVLGAVALLGLLRRGATRFAGGLFALAFLSFVGITGMFFPAHPSGRIDIERYWVSFLPWLGLAAAGVVLTAADLLVRRRGRLGLRPVRPALGRRLARVTLAVLVVTGPAVSTVDDLRGDPTLVVNGNTGFVELSRYLAGRPAPVTIYSDWYSLRILGAYQRSRFGGREVWRGDTVDLISRTAKPKPGDLVVLNSLTTWSCSFCHRLIGTWYAEHHPLPPTWQRVWSSTNHTVVLYRVR